MRPIYAILEEMNSPGAVELDENISEVQSIFSNFNDHVKPFRNIQIVQENERYLSELKQRVLFYLKKRGFWLPDDTLSTIPEHELSLRKITLFLIYNTDTSANGIWESGKNVCHLLNNPKIPKCVLFYCLHELLLFPYFFDFVQYAPTALATAYLDSELISSMEALDPPMRRKISLNLAQSLYHHCWLSAFESELDVQKEVCLSSIQEFLLVVLLEGLPVDRNKIPSCKTTLEFDIYLGHLLKAYLPVVIGCLEASLDKTAPATPSIFQLYQLDDDDDGGRRLGEYNNHAFSQDLMRCVNNLLLNRLQVVLIAVTVRTFYNWVEEDISKAVTLQRAVGELAHKLLNLISENESIDHEVKIGLKAICVQPLKVEDMARNSNIRDLIENIEDPETKDRDVWMREFLSRGELVFGNEECIRVLSENLQLIPVDQLKLVTHFLRDNVGNDQVMATELFQIIFDALAHSNFPENVETFLDGEQPHRIIADYDVDTDVYFQELTEFLNKLVDFPESLTIPMIGPFIKCLAIDPDRALQELQSYCIADTNQITNVLKMLKLQKEFTSSFLDGVVLSLLESLDGANSYKGLELYVTSLFAQGFLEKNYFVKDALFPEILKRSKSKGQTTETWILLQVLRGIFRPEIYQPDADLSAPLLIGLAQVADDHRWDLASYTDTAERIVTLCTELISIIGIDLFGRLECKHKSFILHKAQCMKEMNRYYIEKLFQEDKELDFVKFLHPGSFATDKNKKDFLCKIFVRATLSEKRILASCEDLRPFLLDTMWTIAKAVNGNEKLHGGFQGTFVGLLIIFKENLGRAGWGDNSRFLDLVSLLPVDLYGEHSFVVNDICVKILGMANSGADRKKMELTISGFPECPAKSHLLEQILVNE